MATCCHVSLDTVHPRVLAENIGGARTLSVLASAPCWYRPLIACDYWVCYNLLYNQWSPLGQNLSACPNISARDQGSRVGQLEAPGWVSDKFLKEIFQLIKINCACQNFYLYVINLLRNQNMGVFIANCKRQI